MIKTIDIAMISIATAFSISSQSAVGQELAKLAEAYNQRKNMKDMCDIQQTYLDYLKPDYRKSFICGGYCFFTMPSQEQIDLDLFLCPPPQLRTNFTGTDYGAKQEGWELAPRDSLFSYNNIRVFLCPKCAERSKEKKGLW